jgi:enoyl-CoA hydratase/carnithine racemase
MKQLKKKVPKKIEEMLKKGFESFYTKKEDGAYYYDFEKKNYVPLEPNARIILLPALKDQKKVVKANASATLVDIGDGVACLEFHTKMNAVDDLMIEMIFAACDIVEKDFTGLVVGNHAANFSAGANIFKVLLAAQKGDWDVLETLISEFQNLQTILAKAFETIAMAKVATSAMEAMELGFIRKTDHISLNRDQQIYDAKQVVLGLSKFYKKPRPAMIPVMGENFRGMADAILYNMQHGNFASAHDVLISRKVAHIISGGDCAEGTYVTEQEILDLEKEAFMSLMGEQKTQDRIMHMLTKGKPLRN